MCNGVISEIDNPIHGNENWTVESVYRSPIDGAESDTRYIFHVPGTAGNNNRVEMFLASDVLNCDVYDSGGTKRSSTVAAAADADTDYAAVMKHTSSGEVTCCWEGTCDSTPGADGVMDDVDSTMYLGGTDSVGTDTYVSGYRFHWRKLP